MISNNDLTDDEIAKCVSQRNPDGVIPGTIIAWAGEERPKGYLYCNGEQFDNLRFKDLHKSIKDDWGEGGSTTFNIPDLRGRFLRGVDAGVGVDPDAKKRTENRPGGNEGDNVGTMQDDAYGKHNHHFYGGHGGGGGRPRCHDGGGPSTTEITNYTEIGGHNETRPKNTSVHYCIKF